jgi:hypothetical protein
VGPSLTGWRRCTMCAAMVYDVFDQKGSCPGEGLEHEADGPVFELPHDGPETEHAQRNWRFCRKCFAMHWSPAPDQVCARLGPHDGLGSWNFVLPHTHAPGPEAGSSWRCCVRCAVLFWGASPPAVL